MRASHCGGKRRPHRPAWILAAARARHPIPAGGKPLPGKVNYFVGTGTQQDPIGAALANGVAGHALDYDDTQLSTSPDGVYGLLAPIGAGPGRLYRDRGGGRRVRAGAADCLHRRSRSPPAASRTRSALATTRPAFTPQGPSAPSGSAGACKLLGLTPERLAVALSIAASMASGLRENFGTMTKPLHSGRAASNGVAAALLAQRGFTASGSGLEAPRGFFSAAGGGFVPERIDGRLGRPFFLARPWRLDRAVPLGLLATWPWTCCST